MAAIKVRDTICGQHMHLSEIIFCVLLTYPYIGVGRFRILGGSRFRILGGGGDKGVQIPCRHMTSY